MLEGTLLGRESRDLKSERDVEEGIVELVTGSDKLYFVACSSQNIDRLVSIYRACVRSDRVFVIDPYTAYILDQLKRDFPKLPQHDWGKNIRVFFAPNRYTRQMAEDSVLYKFRSAKITYEQMLEAKSSLIVKDSFLVRHIFAKRGDLEDSGLIYSMWEGYLPDVEDFWRRNSVPVVKIHSSGHASIEDLKVFTKALRPKQIVPFHTFYPDRYSGCFGSNVRILKDGESLGL